MTEKALKGFKAQVDKITGQAKAAVESRNVLALAYNESALTILGANISLQLQLDPRRSPDDSLTPQEAVEAEKYLDQAEKSIPSL